MNVLLRVRGIALLEVVHLGEGGFVLCWRWGKEGTALWEVRLWLERVLGGGSKTECLPRSDCAVLARGEPIVEGARTRSALGGDGARVVSRGARASSVRADGGELGLQLGVCALPECKQLVQGLGESRRWGGEPLEGNQRDRGPRERARVDAFRTRTHALPATIWPSQTRSSTLQALHVDAAVG